MSLDLNIKTIDDLLAQPTTQAQSSYLQAAQRFNPDGLAEVLSWATQLMGSDPGKARQLAIVCEALAPDAGAHELVPSATYLRAQTCAMDANFETALVLIETARAGFAALGDDYEAARTHVGRMFVLQELGRYAEALQAGDAVHQYLKDTDALEPTHASEQANGLAARISQNLGLCHELMGKYDDALLAYADAEARFGLLQMTENLADIRNNRGIVLLRLGRGHDALAAFEKAQAIFDEAKLPFKRAYTLINIGNAHLLVGNYAHGLAVFEQARQSLETLAAQSLKQILLLDVAEAYLSLNLHQEALTAYREADVLLGSSGMQHDHARALWGMGTTLLALGRFDEAEHVLDLSAELFAAADNVPMRALVLLKQAAMNAANGNHAAGLAKAQEALATVAGQAWPLQQTYAHLQIANLVLPNVAQATAHLQACEHLVGQLDMPGLRYLLNQRQGHLKLMAGNFVGAEPLLQAAINEVEQLRSNVAEDRMRISFATDKVAAYDDLIRLYVSRNINGDLSRAFATTERAKARALVVLLNKTKKPQPEAVPSAQLAQLNAVQAELNATYSELMVNPNEGVRKRSLSELQVRAIDLEREISRLQLQLDAVANTDVDRLDAPLPFEAIRSQLRPDTALVSYYICDETIYVFVITSRDVQIVGGDVGLATTASVAPLLQRLSAQWERFRAGREFAQRHAAQLELSAQRVLAALYDAVFRPIESLVQVAQRLIIIPHGVLHQLPFHALFDGTQYLAERFIVSYAPSATALVICQQRTAPGSGQALVVGVADELIPEAAAEAQQVAQVLPQATVLLNEQATLAALRERSMDCDIVHLACHGLFRAGNPMFSSLKMHDGWLLALDAMHLNLHGALVTLSACESGRSQTLSGDEIVGLMRAFLGAGVSSLVVSLWLVQDETTAEFMQVWYDHLRQGVPRAEALRAAQLALKVKFAHPYYWAPFMVVGQN